MDIKKDILWRVYLSFLLIALLSVCVIVRAFYIQRVQGAYWRGLSDSLHLRYMPIQSERGTIYSEDGDILSTSVPIFDVYVDFAAEGLREKSGRRFKDNVDSLSLSLANLFSDKSKLTYKQELQQAYKNKDRYYPLKKKISFEQYKKLKTFPLVRLGRNKSGFIIDARDKRINPYVLLANRTIGLSRLNPKQNVGLEFTYDSVLRGITGQKLMRYSAGTYIPVEGSETEPINGKDIVTTLDTYMQDVAENALMKMLVDNNSIHGTAIVMETATGKIKAIANLGKQADGTYIEDLNYGIGKATEPGSIFKLASLLCLLDDKYVTNESIVNCEGGVKNFYGLKIKDSHFGIGRVTVRNAFLQSSNVAFAKLIDQYYKNNPKKYTDHLHKFRLDQMTGVEIVATSGRPTIKTKLKNRSWSSTTLPFMAHGYEELVTPLHMLMLYNAVANNGKLMKPYLVNAIRSYGVDIRKFDPQVLDEKIVSDETIKQAKECLRAVVDSLHGTAHRICYNTTYAIAGKTGTAVSANGNKGYNKGNKIYQASFMGYFPADKPKYSIAVVIQNSRESKLVYGADVSGRVFKEISDRIYGRYINEAAYADKINADSASNSVYGNKHDLIAISKFMGAKISSEPSSEFWQNMQLFRQNASFNQASEFNSKNNIMPNIVGMGLKDALYLLESKLLKVNIVGKGKVISQSIVAGANFKKGDSITIFLNSGA